MDPNNSYIKNAAYYIYDLGPKINSSICCTASGIPGGSKEVTFYTFDGDAITTIQHSMEFKEKEKLDQQANKIKPKSYRRIWWPAFNVGFGLTKGCPGYAILFHDKNGNRIGWARMDTENDDIEKFSKYDLSESIEEPSDFIKQKPIANNRMCIIS